MRINNQAKVGLATAFCLILQGYVFTYILRVEPHILLVIAPLIPYILYTYARGRRTWYYNKPIYWIAAIIAITLFDMAPYVWDVLGGSGLS